MRNFRRIGSNPHETVLDASEFHHDRLNRVLFLVVGFLILLFVGLFVVFFILFLLFLSFFLALFVEFLAQFVILLAQIILIVGILIHKHEHHIAQRAPRSMAAHSVAVGDKHHGIAVEHPLRCAVEIAVVGDINHLATIGAHNCDIGIWVMAVVDNLEGKPFAVGRPTIVERACATHPVGAVGYLAHLLGLEVEHHEAIAVFDKGEFFSIGRELRISALHLVGGDERLLVHDCGIGEIEVFLSCDSRLVKSPFAAALAGVGDCAIVCPSNRFFSLGSFGDSLGGWIFHRSNKHLASHNKCHLLSVGRHRCRVQAAGVGSVDIATVVVAHEVDFHLARRCRHSVLCVNLAVVGIAEHPVAGNREETHRMCLKFGNSLHLCGLRDSHAIHVEAAAVAFAKEIHIFAVGRIHRVAVFAGVRCKVSVLAGFGVVHPHIAGYRRSVVLAPLVFKAFLVLIEECIAGFVECHLLCRSCEHLHRASAIHRHLVQLGLARCRERHARHRVLDCGAEIYIFTIGAECRWEFGSRVESDALGGTTRRGHYKEVEVAVAVACKSNLFPVGRPHRLALIRIARGELHRRATARRHLIYITLVTEHYFAPIGRNFHIAEPQRCRCRATDCGYRHQQCQKHLFHSVLFFLYIIVIHFYAKHDSAQGCGTQIGDKKRHIGYQPTLNGKQEAAHTHQQKCAERNIVGLASSYCFNRLWQIAEHHRHTCYIAYNLL